MDEYTKITSPICGTKKFKKGFVTRKRDKLRILYTNQIIRSYFIYIREESIDADINITGFAKIDSIL